MQNHLQKRLPLLAAAALIAIAVALSLYQAFIRADAEGAQKSAEIVMQWEQLTLLAREENLATEIVLEEINEVITGVLFKEQTVYTLADEGRATLVAGQDLFLQSRLSDMVLPAVDPSRNYVIFYDEADMERALRELSYKTPLAAEHFYSADGFYMISAALTNTELSATGIGFDPRALDMAAAAGLRVLVQIRGYERISGEDIEKMLSPLAGYSLIAVGFNDNSIPGAALTSNEWPAIRDAWAEGINRLNVPLMSIEFMAQRGLEGLSQVMDDRVVRLHSISEAEMRMDDRVSDAPRRFALAVSERNIRIAFVRTLSGGLEENIEFIASVKDAVEDTGMEIGALKPFVGVTVSAPVLAAIALGVSAGVWLLLRQLRFGRAAIILAALVFAAALGLIAIGRIAMMQKIFALGAALVFPTLSLLYFISKKPRSILASAGKAGQITLFSLIGAAMMTGLLCDSSYMLAIDQFMGVKIAHLLPPLAVAGFFFFFADEYRRPWNKLTATLDMSVQVKTALLAVIVVAGLGFYLLRTGNENAAVAGIELTLRNLLDRILLVRPRTKEFLLGFPALMLLIRYGYRDAMLPILVLAAIGQVSLVNTFAHIHTPLWASLLRTFNGFWLGIVIGILAILAAGALIAFTRRQTQNSGKLH